MTLAAEVPARPPDARDAPAPALGPHIARLMAEKLLARGDTPEGVREYAAGRPEFAYMWDAVAGAMDEIAAARSVPAQRAPLAREAAPA